MTTITATVITHSVSPERNELLSVQLRYPKFIHDELMTHRVFSRNASSSRAIPIARLIDDVLADTAVPSFGKLNKPGMQPGETTPAHVRQQLVDQWLWGRDEAVARARTMASLGAAKQDVNRIIEPYSHINVLVTGTEWANFDKLRRHPMAMQEMQWLAEAIYAAKRNSTPKLLLPGEWHLPYVDLTTDVDLLRSPPDGYRHTDEVTTRWFTECLLKVSAARCARVSYLTHELKRATYAEDADLYWRLVVRDSGDGDDPLHASPTEHQATPDSIHPDYGWDAPRYGAGRNSREDYLDDRTRWEHPQEHGNLYGWRQHRKMLPGEYVYDR